MKKLLFTFNLLLLFLITSLPQVNAQFCYDNLSLTLNYTGNAILTTDIILSGDLTYKEISKDNINFGSTVSLDCTDLGPVTIYARDTQTGDECSTEINVEDHSGPTPICHQLSSFIPTTSGIIINAIDFNDSSIDNCTQQENLRYTFGINPSSDASYSEANKSSSKIFYESDFANGPITIKMYVWDEQDNYDYCMVNVSISSNQEIACSNLVEVSLNPVGKATVVPNMIIEGSYNGILEMSADGTNFYPSLTYDCDNIGMLVEITIRDSVTKLACWSRIKITDRLAPSIVAKDVSFDLSHESETIILKLEDILIATNDNCSSLVTYSPSQFDVYDLGHNKVTVKATDSAGNIASAVADVYITLNGDPFATICHPEISLTTDAFNCERETIIASDLYVGNAVHDSSRVSLNNITFVETLEDFDQSLESPFIVYVETIDDGIASYCQTEVTLIDNVPPVVTTVDSLQLVYTNSITKLFASSIDNGSFDYCSSVSLLIAKYPSVGIWDAAPFITFTEGDIGDQKVVLYAEDESGNWNSTYTIVSLIGNAQCTLNNIRLPDYILDITVPVIQRLTPENLIYHYGFYKEQVEPIWDSSCNGLVSSYADQIFLVGNVGFKILRTWHMIDFYTNESRTYNQIIKAFNNNNNGELTCLNTTIEAYSDTRQLYANELLVYPTSNTNLTLEVYENNSDIIVDNLLLQEHIGQTFEFIIIDHNSNDQCNGTISISGISGCAYDGSNIDWPNDVINMANPNIDPTSITPDVLVSDYGYTPTEVKVLLNKDSCSLVGITYDDVVFNYQNGFFKIIREFTVVDWKSYQANSSVGIWKYTQLIKNIIDPETLICDVLPRGSAIGTCDDGHTLSDQVEWPNDLEISDYRITPDELGLYSSVNILDAKPSFYHPESTPQYNTTYADIFVGISATTVELARVWTVSHLKYGHTWNYSQKLIIDFSDFENLVTVHTTTGRAVPNVIINETAYTGIDGAVQLEDDNIISLVLEDEALNGITIVDLVTIQSHILYLQRLSKEQLLAADFNQDTKIDVVDFFNIRNALTGKTVLNDNNWIFRDNNINVSQQFKPKGKYTAYKLGDVDDSALLGDEVIADPENTFEFEDILLNNGQSYDIPVHLKNEILTKGLELRMQLDLSKIKVNSISTSVFEMPIGSWYVSNDGILTVVLYTNGYSVEIGGANNIELSINVTALDNTILGEAMTTEGIPSYSASDDFTLVVLNANLNNQITLGVWDEELSGLSIYPNPATDYLIIDRSKVNVSGDMIVSIYEMNGQKVISNTSSHIDISKLNAGMYFYKIDIDGYTYTDKLSIVK